MAAGGEVIELRSWSPGDESALVRLANNRNVWRNLTNRFPHPYTHEDAVAWIGTANERSEDGRQYPIWLGGEIVGAVGFQRRDDLQTLSAEIGYWIGEPFWGRGIATEALSLATAVAFREYDFVRLQAGVLEWNPASCRVLEKAGYQLEARQRQQAYKDGEVCDMFSYVMLRSEFEARAGSD